MNEPEAQPISNASPAGIRGNKSRVPSHLNFVLSRRMVEGADACSDRSAR
jgi:hypothetical protein